MNGIHVDLTRRPVEVVVRIYVNRPVHPTSIPKYDRRPPVAPHASVVSVERVDVASSAYRATVNVRDMRAPSVAARTT